MKINFEQEIDIIFDKYNSDLNPKFTESDKQHIKRVIRRVLREYVIEQLQNGELLQAKTK